MLQRRKYYYRKHFLFKNFQERYVTSLIKASFLQNHFLQPKLRLSFLKFRDSLKRQFFFFNSADKLVCYYNFTRRVPTRRLLLGRFSLVRHMNTLTLGPFQK